MKPALFHAQAEAEVREAITFYEGKRAGLGGDFLAELEAAASFIVRRPEACPAHGDQGLRKWHLRRFPFTVYFLELETMIWIVALAHQRRRPGYWKRRMK